MQWVKIISEKYYFFMQLHLTRNILYFFHCRSLNATELPRETAVRRCRKIEILLLCLAQSAQYFIDTNG